MTAMHWLVRVFSPQEAASYVASASDSFDSAILSSHGVDEHWTMLSADGNVSARASLWWRNTPPHKQHRIGVIGHFATENIACGTALLEYAVQRLREEGCTMAVGPMDGNTWRRYRLMTHRGDEPEFFLEPTNPAEWLRSFSDAGFEPIAEYFSALNEDLTFEDPQVASAGERLAKSGIRLRSLDVDHLDDELRRIYQVAEVSFRANFLYTPLSQNEFIGSYRALAGILRPELILIAEQENEPVGFVFTIPDRAQQQRGQWIDTVIVKTVAVLPDRRCAGLGAWLVAQTQIAARQLGYRRAIHALMYQSNQSRNLSARYAKTFRRYALFARTL